MEKKRARAGERDVMDGCNGGWVTLMWNAECGVCAGVCTMKT